MMAQITISNSPIISADNEPKVMKIITVFDVMLCIVKSGVNNDPESCELIVFVSKKPFHQLTTT